MAEGDWRGKHNPLRHVHVATGATFCESRYGGCDESCYASGNLAAWCECCRVAEYGDPWDAIARVLSVHTPLVGEPGEEVWCSACCEGDPTPYPCLTVRSLPAGNVNRHA